MIHPVPLSVFSEILTAIFGFLFLLFFIAIASVIVFGLLVLKALPHIVGFVEGFLLTLADANDADSGQATGASSQQKRSVSTGTGSNAPEPRHAGSEAAGSDGGKGPYETNEYGELVEEK